MNPDYLPALRAQQRRTTRMRCALSWDARRSEFQAMAGTVAATTVKGIARVVPGRWRDGAYRFTGTSLC